MSRYKNTHSLYHPNCENTLCVSGDSYVLLLQLARHIKPVLYIQNFNNLSEISDK